MNANAVYEFEARLPIDHVLAAVRLVRSEGYSTAELLKLLGSASGELGALFSKGPIFGTTDVSFAAGWMEQEDAQEKVDMIISSLELLESNPQFDPTPYIPLIIALIEWLIRRRG